MTTAAASLGRADVNIYSTRKDHRRAMVAKYGWGFVDVIIGDAHEYGRGQAGYSCLFGGYHTARPGISLVEFARLAFERGTLKPIGDDRWVVLNRAS